MNRLIVTVGSIFTTVMALLFGGLAVRSALAAQPASAKVIVPAPSTEIEKLIKERETAFQQSIYQANLEIQQLNDRLTKTNQALQDVTNKSNGLQTATASTTATTTTQYYVKSDIAMKLARSAANGVEPSNAPELVLFSGVAAYEVPFASGNVYVDANTGQVLYNGAIPPAPRLISEQEAINIANDYFQDKQVVNTVYHVIINSKPLFKVYFTSGNSVFVDTSGQIIYVQMLKRYGINGVPITTGTGGGGNGGSNSGGGGEHESAGDD